MCRSIGMPRTSHQIRQHCYCCVMEHRLDPITLAAVDRFSQFFYLQNLENSLCRPIHDTISTCFKCISTLSCKFKNSELLSNFYSSSRTVFANETLQNTPLKLPLVQLFFLETRTIIYKNHNHNVLILFAKHFVGIKRSLKNYEKCFCYCFNKSVKIRSTFLHVSN